MSQPFGRAATAVVLLVATAAAATGQPAADLCDQLRKLSSLEHLRKSVDVYKGMDSMVGELANAIQAEIEGCRSTPQLPSCAPDALDRKEREAEKLRGKAKQLRDQLRDIEGHLREADEKRRELEGKMQDKAACRTTG